MRFASGGTASRLAILWKEDTSLFRIVLTKVAIQIVRVAESLLHLAMVRILCQDGQCFNKFLFIAMWIRIFSLLVLNFNIH